MQISERDKIEAIPDLSQFFCMVGEKVDSVQLLFGNHKKAEEHETLNMNCVVLNHSWEVPEKMHTIIISFGCQ